MTETTRENGRTQEPATVDQGREPPAGSRGEGSIPDQAAATPIESQASIDWECMSCGRVYPEAINPCPNCGGLVRKVGQAADPVFSEHKEPADNPTPMANPPTSGDSTENPADPSAAGGNVGGYTSTKIEDITARGEEDANPSQPDDPDEAARQKFGGDSRLSAEKVHPTDKGSPGGGGGVGGT